VSESSVELVRRAWDAALRGDVEQLEPLLAPDLYWGAPGAGEYACHNREQALRWMREGIKRGVRARLLEVRELGDGRVLVVLQRLEGGTDAEPAPPHAQLIRVRDDQIAEMVVYPSPAEAEAAAGPA
jgi:ketosteroid isomerase-like protein